MKGICLTFNLREENAGRLRYLCMRLNLEWKAADAALCALPLKEGLKRRTVPSPGEELPFPERLILLCGLDDNRLDEALRGLNETGMPETDFKAILTPTNRNWTPVQLMEHLRAERTATQHTEEVQP